MAERFWTKKIKYDYDNNICIVELVRFVPFVSKRDEARAKAALARVIEKELGLKPGLLLLGRLGNDPQASWWVREVSIDLTD